MEIESLIHEPAYSEVAELCSRVAEQGEYLSVPPTPVVSPFWGTTFTPSSSEIIFRKIESSNQSARRFCSCQPCIRVTDLPHVGDDWHLLLFHMISFVSFDTTSVEEELRLLIRMLTDAAACDVSDLYFTVSTNPAFSSSGEKISLGTDLLQKLGVPHENLFSCSGTANYQDASLNTSQGTEVSMTGPKAEVFVRERGGLREIGTFELAKANLNRSSKDVFAFVVGLERITAVRNQTSRIADLPTRKNIADKIRKRAFDDGFASTSVAREAAVASIAIADALAHILSASSQTGSDPDFQIKGLRNHYNRIVKAFKRVADSSGIPYELVTEAVSEKERSKIGRLLDRSLQKGPVKKRPEYG